jgi:hypothetical protein
MHWAYTATNRSRNDDFNREDGYMAGAVAHSSQLANPLASIDQLAASGTQFDGVPAHLERSILSGGAQLTQAAGVLLRLPQDVIAQAIITFSRFCVGPEGGSLRDFGALVRTRRPWR